jgi:hypothetical protein
MPRADRLHWELTHLWQDIDLARVPFLDPQVRLQDSARAELERTKAKLLIRRAECRTLGSERKSSTLSPSQSTRTITSAPAAPIERTLHLCTLPSISVMLN